jgi:hypothetical protein
MTMGINDDDDSSHDYDDINDDDHGTNLTKTLLNLIVITFIITFIYQQSINYNRKQIN